MAACEAAGFSASSKLPSPSAFLFFHTTMRFSSFFPQNGGQISSASNQRSLRPPSNRRYDSALTTQPASHIMFQSVHYQSQWRPRPFTRPILASPVLVRQSDVWWGVEQSSDCASGLQPALRIAHSSCKSTASCGSLATEGSEGSPPLLGRGPDFRDECLSFWIPAKIEHPCLRVLFRRHLALSPDV